MTRFAILTIVLMSLFCSTAQAGGAKTVWVNAYTRADGTYVSGYWRSPPDGIGAGRSPSLVSSSYIPAGTTSYTALQEKPVPKDVYRYDINIYQSGKLVVQVSRRYAGGSTAEDSIQLAAESSVFKAQEGLRSKLYEKGLGHQQVNSIVLSAFTADACQLQEAPPDTTTSEYRIYHNYTMDCIIPVIPDPPPPPPDTKKKK